MGPLRLLCIWLYTGSGTVGTASNIWGLTHSKVFFRKGSLRSRLKLKILNDV